MRCLNTVLALALAGFGLSQTRVVPTSLSVDKGYVVSGDLASLQEDDQNPLVVAYFFTPGDTRHNQRLFFTVGANTTDLQPSQVTLRVKAKAVSVGVITLALEMFNWETNLYERSPQVQFAGLYQTYDFTPTGDASRFVRQSDGAVKARFWTFGGLGPLSQFFMTDAVETMHWSITE